ncbi:hypothetical protein [Azohydromonas australica]|uniref:hypothetical protein n=1 Tax=Azohydromonas australica TaxID=364039 RepID=UPI0012EC45E6|nr:hypothetical protein [Azohydromonas australica]
MKAVKLREKCLLKEITVLPQLPSPDLVLDFVGIYIIILNLKHVSPGVAVNLIRWRLKLTAIHVPVAAKIQIATSVMARA